jgi:hypothetical protein
MLKVLQIQRVKKITGCHVVIVLDAKRASQVKKAKQA